MRNRQPTVIVAQRALLREGLAALLHQSVYKVVESVARASQLNRSLAARRTLVILGVEEASGNVAEASANISFLRSLFSESTIVVVAETRDPVDIMQILSLAPDGYVVNLGSGEVLLKLLDLALMDQQVIVLARATPLPSSGHNTGSDNWTSSPRSSTGDDFKLLPGLPNALKEPQLSQRERQVLLHLAEGDSNKVIARVCNITESTVKVYLKTILRKLGAHNRTQAAIWAIQKGYRVSSGHPNG